MSYNSGTSLSSGTGSLGNESTGLTPEQETDLENTVKPYDSGETYSANTIVSYEGAFYNSKVDGNIGNTPNTSTTEWDNISDANIHDVIKSEIIAQYSSSITGDIDFPDSADEKGDFYTIPFDTDDTSGGANDVSLSNNRFTISESGVYNISALFDISDTASSGSPRKTVSVQLRRERGGVIKVFDTKPAYFRFITNIFTAEFSVSKSLANLEANDIIDVVVKITGNENTTKLVLNEGQTIEFEKFQAFQATGEVVTDDDVITEWVSTNHYNVDELCFLAGIIYKRLVAGTTSESPSTDTTNWEASGSGDAVYVSDASELKTQAETPNNTVVLKNSIVYEITSEINVESGVTIIGNGAMILKSATTHGGLLVKQKHNVKIKDVYVVGATASFSGDPSIDALSSVSWSATQTDYTRDDYGIEVSQSQAVELNGCTVIGVKGIAFFIRGNQNALGTETRNSQCFYFNLNALRCHGGFVELQTSTALGDSVDGDGHYYWESTNFRATYCRIAWWQCSSNNQINGLNVDACTYLFIGAISDSGSSYSDGWTQTRGQTGHGRYNGITFNHGVTYNDSNTSIGGVTLNTTNFPSGAYIRATQANLIENWVQFNGILDVRDILTSGTSKQVQWINGGQFATTGIANFNFQGGFNPNVAVDRRLDNVINELVYDNDESKKIVKATQLFDFNTYSETGQHGFFPGLQQTSSLKAFQLEDTPNWGKCLTVNNADRGGFLRFTDVSQTVKNWTTVVASQGLGNTADNTYSLAMMIAAQPDNGDVTYNDITLSGLIVKLLRKDASDFRVQVYRLSSGITSSSLRLETILNSTVTPPVDIDTSELLTRFKVVDNGDDTSTVTVELKTDATDWTEFVNTTYDHSYTDDTVTTDLSSGWIGLSSQAGGDDQFDNLAIKKIYFRNDDTQETTYDEDWKEVLGYGGTTDSATIHHTGTGTLNLTHATHNYPSNIVHVSNTGDLAITNTDTVDATEFVIFNTTSNDRQLSFTGFTGIYIREGGTLSLETSPLTITANSEMKVSITENGGLYYANLTDSVKVTGSGLTQDQIDDIAKIDTIETDVEASVKLWSSTKTYSDQEMTLYIDGVYRSTKDNNTSIPDQADWTLFYYVLDTDKNDVLELDDDESLWNIVVVESIDDTDYVDDNTFILAQDSSVMVAGIVAGNPRTCRGSAIIRSGNLINDDFIIYLRTTNEHYKWDETLQSWVKIDIAANVQTELDSKVNTTDIVDDLTSTSAVVPLSANQGNVIDGRVTSNANALAGVTTSTVVSYDYSNQASLVARGITDLADSGFLFQGGLLTNAITESDVTQNPSDENDITFNTTAYGHGLKTVSINGTDQQVYAFLSCADGGASLNIRSEISDSQIWQDIYDYGAFWKFEGFFIPSQTEARNTSFTAIGHSSANNPDPNNSNSRRIGGQIKATDSGGTYYVAFRETSGGTDYIMDGQGGTPTFVADRFYDIAIAIPSNFGSAKIWMRLHGDTEWIDTTAVFLFHDDTQATFINHFVLSDGTGGDSNCARLIKEISLTVYESSTTQSLTEVQTNVNNIIARIPEGSADRTYTLNLSRDGARAVGNQITIESNAPTSIIIQDDTSSGQEQVYFINNEGQPDNTFSRDLVPGSLVVLENVLPDGQYYKVTNDVAVEALEQIYMYAYSDAIQQRTGQNNVQDITFNVTGKSKGDIVKSANNTDFVFNKSCKIQITITPQLRRVDAGNPNTEFDVLFYLLKSTNDGIDFTVVPDSDFVRTVSAVGITGISPGIVVLDVVSGEVYKVVWKTNAAHGTDMMELYAVPKVDTGSVNNDTPLVPSARIVFAELSDKIFTG